MSTGIPKGGITDLETHSYDGTLIEQSSYIQKIANKLEYDRDAAFSHLKQIILESSDVVENHKPAAIEAINRIQRDVLSPANVDSTNHVRAADLLLFLYDVVEKVVNCDCGKVYHLDNSPPRQRDVCNIIHPKFNRDLKSRELLPVLTEQLHDIVVSGQCPQGRCTRLIQLSLPFTQGDEDGSMDILYRKWF